MKNYFYYSNAKFFIVLISLFIFSNCIYTIRASDCSPKNDCDPNQKYPFWICRSSSVNFTGLRCLNLDDIKKYYDDRQIPAPKFPICLEFDGMIDAVYLSKKNITVFDSESVILDLKKAVDRWNCICSGQSAGSCQCKIKVKFTGPNDDYKMKNELAMTKISIKDNECKMDCEGSYIVINNSNMFMYGTDNPRPGDEPNKFFITDYYAKDPVTMQALKDNDCDVYNFTEIIMHEVGHLFSFGHYDDDACGNASDPNEIMNSTQRPTNGTSKELSDYEKCRFQALYCFSSIYEYEPHSSNLYPNPSHNEVVLEFELEASYDNVTIEVYDGLGNVLLTPVENKTYEFGLNRELINVSSLENGYYYVIINTSTKKYVKPFIVIK